MIHLILLGTHGPFSFAIQWVLSFPLEDGDRGCTSKITFNHKYNRLTGSLILQKLSSKFLLHSFLIWTTCPHQCHSTGSKEYIIISNTSVSIVYNSNGLRHLHIAA